MVVRSTVGYSLSTVPCRSTNTLHGHVIRSPISTTDVPKAGSAAIERIAALDALPLVTAEARYNKEDACISDYVRLAGVYTAKGEMLASRPGDRELYQLVGERRACALV